MKKNHNSAPTVPPEQPPAQKNTPLGVHGLPRLLIAGPGGSTGKTIISLGLARFWKGAGHTVAAFKKGPDYIDAAWLGRAATKEHDCPARTLDPYFLSADLLRETFLRHALATDISIIEGNRGLFDGRDAAGSCSTAEVARSIEAPLVVVLNVERMTRTAAALLAGLAAFEPNLRIDGVILNRVGAPRHAQAVQAAIEYHTDIPVLGAVPRLIPSPIPERAMGLAAGYGDAWNRAEEILDNLARVVTQHTDTAKLWEIAHTATPLAPAAPCPSQQQNPTGEKKTRPRIGYVHDAALWFYYPENLEALRHAGAELVRLSILSPALWPDLDGLYLGGGFPEAFADAISAQEGHFACIRRMAAARRPIYAECGGALLLAQAIEQGGTRYPMTGIFPHSVQCHSRPQGLGYVEARAVADTPFHPAGTTFKGHIFHYTSLVPPLQKAQLELYGNFNNGAPQPDGLARNAIFAAYTHLYAPAVPHWAPAFVRAAQKG